MPIGLLGAAAISGGMGLLQTGLGLFDRRKGKKKLEEAQSFYQQNKMQIPESAKAALGVAERGVSPTLPAEDLRRAQIGERVAQGVGAAQSAATSSSDVLSMLSNLYGQSMGAEQDLAIAGAERYDRRQDALRGELGRMADWEQQRWNYNVLMPYEQMLGQAEAYSQRGAEGIGMGLSTMGGVAGDYATGVSAQNQYNSFLGSKGFTMGDVYGNRAPQRMAPIAPSLSGGYSQPTGLMGL